MSRINLDSISIPSSLRVFPTTSWATSDYLVAREYDHLRCTDTCAICSGWQSVEEIVVHRPNSSSIKRTILRCHNPKERYVHRCAPQILSEVPLDEYPQP